MKIRAWLVATSGSSGWEKSSNTKIFLFFKIFKVPICTCWIMFGKFWVNEFWTPAPPPPSPSFLQKLRIDSEWPKTARNGSWT